MMRGLLAEDLGAAGALNDRRRLSQRIVLCVNNKGVLRDRHGPVKVTGKGARDLCRHDPSVKSHEEHHQAEGVQTGECVRGGPRRTLPRPEPKRCKSIGTGNDQKQPVDGGSASRGGRGR